MKTMNRIVNSHALRRFHEANKANNLKRRMYWRDVVLHTENQLPAMLRKQAF